MLCSSMEAQFTLTGTVFNESREPLVAASVFLTHTQYAAITDENGKFVIEDIEEGIYILKASYLGYRSSKEDIDLFTDMEVDIELEGVKYDLDKIEISANSLDEDSGIDSDSKKTRRRAKDASADILNVIHSGFGICLD